MKQALPGDYYQYNLEIGSTASNVFTYEDDNATVSAKLQNMLDVELQVPMDTPFNVMHFLSMCVESEYNIYDMTVARETTTDDGSQTSYEVYFTMYKSPTSHGKRIRSLIVLNTSTLKMSAVIKLIQVEGIVPQDHIRELQAPVFGVNNPSSACGPTPGNKTDDQYESIHFKPITSDPIFGQVAASNYLCTRAKRLKEDHNLIVDCNDSNMNLRST